MKFVPVSARMSPARHSNTVSSTASNTASNAAADMAGQHRSPQTPRSLFAQAALLGLCCGLVIIGLMENATRLSAPETLSLAHSERRIAAEADAMDAPPHMDAPSQMNAPSQVAARADRLDLMR